MPRVSLRPIHPGDDAAVAAIIRTVMTEFGAVGEGFAINDAEVDCMSRTYSVPGAAFFVVEMDGRVVGGAGVAPLAGGEPGVCELRKMYLLEEARGLRIGERLLRQCLDTARSLGYRVCYLETTKGMEVAQRLYEKVGFRRLPAPMGATGHHGCDRYYVLDL